MCCRRGHGARPPGAESGATDVIIRSGYFCRFTRVCGFFFHFTSKPACSTINAYRLLVYLVFTLVFFEFYVGINDNVLLIENALTFKTRHSFVVMFFYYS